MSIVLRGTTFICTIIVNSSMNAPIEKMLFTGFAFVNRDLLDWTTSTRSSTSFEFQTSDVYRALALHAGFR